MYNDHRNDDMIGAALFAALIALLTIGSVIAAAVPI